MVSEFTASIIAVIRGIPPGKVMTYGGVAAAAGNPMGARQVTRILHSSSRKYDLPWHRVVNVKGMIALGNPNAYAEQKVLLLNEGVMFGENDRIDLRKFGVR